MKTTKRILAIALALVLGLALFAPVASAADDPNAPIITKQPTKSNGTFYLQAGKALQLDVEATPPEGSQGTLSYAWYDYNWQQGDTAPPVATGASVTIPTSEDMVLKVFEESGRISSSSAIFIYCVVVTNTWLDDEQVPQSTSRRSDIVSVKLFVDYGTMISLLWGGVIKGDFSMLLKNMPFNIPITCGVLLQVLAGKLIMLLQDLQDIVASIA